ncbi:MAG: hypothetical protein WC604_03075 [Candidatus Gracilibacteria bacterium]
MSQSKKTLPETDSVLPREMVGKGSDLAKKIVENSRNTTKTIKLSRSSNRSNTVGHVRRVDNLNSLINFRLVEEKQRNPEEWNRFLQRGRVLLEVMEVV